jgi:pyruvate dehydrogenase E2 component (dihydrolipoamide acetyltransferase)
VLAPGEAPPPVPPAPAPAPAATSAPAPPAAPVTGQAPPQARERRVTPVARRRAAELGVDLAHVTGSGPGGRITESDVLAAAGHGAGGGGTTGAPAAAGAAVPGPVIPPAPRIARRVPLSGMRGLIARRMQQSLATTAQLTVTREVDAGPLVQLRRSLTAEAASAGGSISYDALLAKALASALVEQPALNAVVEGEAILVLADVHVGVAVAVDGGLVVPVLRAPAHRPISELADELNDLVTRARQGRLRPEDMEGGTVTLTNLGQHKVDAFTPILNPPQSAILGVGQIAPRPFVDAHGQLALRPTVHLSLTFDHRVADGAEAATLLDRMVAHWPHLADERSRQG